MKPLLEIATLALVLGGGFLVLAYISDLMHRSLLRAQARAEFRRHVQAALDGDRHAIQCATRACETLTELEG